MTLTASLKSMGMIMVLVEEPAEGGIEMEKPLSNRIATLVVSFGCRGRNMQFGPAGQHGRLMLLSIFRCYDRLSRQC